MYVCICHAITETQILAAVEDGAEDMTDLALSLGVGSCCGTCTDHAEAVLNRAAAASYGDSPRDSLGVHHYRPAAAAV